MTHSTYQSGLLFTQAHKAFRARIYALLEQHGLTPTSWSIIGVVAQEPDGIRLSNIAAALAVKPPMISVIVDELMQATILKQIPHHRDGRVKLLALTERGKGLALTVERRLDDEMRHLLGGLEATDIAIFEKTLQTILANASTVHH